MSNIQLNSKIRKVKDIPWNETLFIDKINFDQNLFNIHKQRIDKVFEKATEQVREEQLQNILLRDTLFNKSMEIIASCYEYEIDKNDIENFVQPLKINFPIGDNPEEIYNKRISEIAQKLVQKQLIFNQLAKDENITVDKDETMKVLNEYYEATNMPINEIISDPQKLTSAVSALLEEKITAFIINKFPKNLDKLFENMEKDLEDQSFKNATIQEDENSGK